MATGYPHLVLITCVHIVYLDSPLLPCILDSSAKKTTARKKREVLLSSLVSLLFFILLFVLHIRLMNIGLEIMACCESSASTQGISPSLSDDQASIFPFASPC